MLEDVVEYPIPNYSWLLFFACSALWYLDIFLYSSKKKWIVEISLVLLKCSWPFPVNTRRYLDVVSTFFLNVMDVRWTLNQRWVLYINFRTKHFERKLLRVNFSPYYSTNLSEMDSCFDLLIVWLIVLYVLCKIPLWRFQM